MRRKVSQFSLFSSFSLHLVLTWVLSCFDSSRVDKVFVCFVFCLLVFFVCFKVERNEDSWRGGRSFQNYQHPHLFKQFKAHFSAMTLLFKSSWRTNACVFLTGRTGNKCNAEILQDWHMIHTYDRISDFKQHFPPMITFSLCKTWKIPRSFKKNNTHNPINQRWPLLTTWQSSFLSFL